MTTTNSKHTAGPWHTGGTFYYPDEHGRKRQNIWGPTDHASGHSSGELICQSATVANARLIAAAPDLLAALEALVEFSEPDSIIDQQSDARLRLEQLAALTTAREAIAKATNP